MIFNNLEATRIFYLPDFPKVLLAIFSSKLTVDIVKNDTLAYGVDEKGYITWIHLLNVDMEYATPGLQHLTDELKAKVESYVQIKIPWVDARDFVVGQVVEIEPLQRFQLAKVNIGNQVVSIVCGAANLHLNQKTVVALNNSVLPDGTLIREGDVGGVMSMGMLCSLSELTNRPSAKGIVSVKSKYENGSIVNLLQLEDWLC